MSRPARAVLDAKALRHNLTRVRQCAPGAKVMAVVKANGYGHGMAWTAGALTDADAFGVASLEEGLELRSAGVAQDICLLEGFFSAEELPLISRHALAPVIHHEGQLRTLERAAGQGPLDVWLKIDTGMHRLGFAPARANDALARLKACSCVRSVRVLSHFANAD